MRNLSKKGVPVPGPGHAVNLPSLAEKADKENHVDKSDDNTIQQEPLIHQLHHDKHNDHGRQHLKRMLHLLAHAGAVFEITDIHKKHLYQHDGVARTIQSAPVIAAPSVKPEQYAVLQIQKDKDSIEADKGSKHPPGSHDAVLVVYMLQHI